MKKKINEILDTAQAAILTFEAVAIVLIAYVVNKIRNYKN